jgi:predicted PurR-regulated permease PerM
MVAILDGWVPPRNRPTVHRLAGEIDAAISGFLRGQAVVCLLVGIYYAVALSLIGLKFGLLIGVAAGVLTFMPYIGSMAGLLIAVGVAFGQFWPQWTSIVEVVAVFLVGQFVEGNVLGPKLVGDNVGLHPVWLIFAMFAFGYLLGFVGLLIAVPLAAAIAVLFRFGLSRYYESPFYQGEEPG